MKNVILLSLLLGIKSSECEIFFKFNFDLRIHYLTVKWAKKSVIFEATLFTTNLMIAIFFLFEPTTVSSEQFCNCFE